MINFHKYEGAGNDFIMINNLDKKLVLSPEQIKHLCDRHFGIGADGVILLESSEQADCFMNYYNSDGTQAEMCGNGVRCTAKFFLEQMEQNKVLLYSVKIDTRAGIKEVKINVDGTYSVDIGAPIFEHNDFPNSVSSTGTKIEGLDFQFVSMGNPHAVTEVENIENIDFKTIGQKVENNPLFPNKINVEFLEKVNNNYYKVKVWERGCGATLACGTGAGAIYSILNKLPARTFLAEEEITLDFPGGKLFLSKNEQDHVILRGPATFVFKGEII
jgi:diaminopimelate epimerase